METMFGRYRLEELIGRGGMGEVYRAYDTDEQRLVAIKRLPSRLGADPQFEQRFRRECATVAALHHPHIVTVNSSGEIDGQLYLDMELIDGPDLGTLLSRNGPLPIERAVEIVGQVAAALDAAHAGGVVHRDVKPADRKRLHHDHASDPDRHRKHPRVPLRPDRDADRLPIRMPHLRMADGSDAGR